MISLYYINLERTPERRAFMEEQLAKQKLKATRLSAVDAFDAPNPTEYSPASWFDRWSLTQSEVACFESHRLAWRAIRDGDAPFGVVMEDDIILSSNFAAVLGKLTTAAAHSDVIKLDGINQRSRFGQLNNDHGAPLRVIKQTIGSAAAYLITRESAARLETCASRYCDHLDDYIFTPRHRWRLYQLDPAIAVQGMFITDYNNTLENSVTMSERTSDQQINIDNGKGPFVFRAKKELKRSGRKIYWAVWADRKLLSGGGIIQYPNLEADLGKYRQGIIC